MALFVPKEYEGKLIFEELYEWLRDEKEKRDKQKSESGKSSQSCKSPGKGKGEKNES
jgi:hypothetical protein